MGFLTEEARYNGLALSLQPWVRIEQPRCNAPRVVFMVTWQSDKDQVALVDAPTLKLGGLTISPVDYVTSSDRFTKPSISMMFNTTCASLDGAELQLHQVQINGKRVPVEPIRLSYKSESRTSIEPSLLQMKLH